MFSSKPDASQLMKDLQAVVEDAEALLHSTKGPVGSAVDDARSRAEETIRAARARLDSLQDEVADRTREAAKAADDYMRDNPWTVVGVAAGVGFVIGLLVGRR
jgi:ElaB/YqjD/DUF883 family membrane-anchored ribosome-binding protein